MKKSLTFLLLFLSLTLSAQYRLDVGLGYDYPKVGFKKGYTDYHFENGKFSGYYGNVGLERQREHFFSYSFGIGYVNRDAKNKTYYNPANSNVGDSSISNTQFKFGNTQIYFLTKFFLIKNVKLALELGLNYERELFRIDKTDGFSEFRWNNSFDFNSIAGNVGLSYTHSLNEKVNLYVQASLAKSVLDIGFSYYDPKLGEMYAPLDFRLKFGATFGVFKNDFTFKKRIQENFEAKQKRKFLRQEISIKAGYIYKQRKLVGDKYYYSINKNLYQSNYIEDMYFDAYSSESNGIKLGFAYCDERYYFPFELDIMYNRINIHSVGSYDVNYGHSIPWGYNNSYRDYNNFFTSNSVAISPIVGIGIKLFRPSEKFNLIPVFKISPTFVLLTNIQDSYTIETRHYFWNPQTPGQAYPAYAQDSIYISDLFYNQKAYIDFTVGAVTNYRITPTWGIESEIGIGLNRTYSMNDIEEHLMDRLQFFGSVALTYNIRLGDKSVDPYTIKTY